MANKDVYEEFAIDLMSAAPLDIDSARKLAYWLYNEDYVDYDTLKEIYLYSDEEGEDEDE